LRIIHLDEITHVTSGHRWFTWQCALESKEPVTTFRRLVTERFAGQLKGPFNSEDREKAGMTREFYEDLSGNKDQNPDGRPSVMVEYDSVVPNGNS
jgi:uncharacterized ferritin-like protein (DUF455 family)